MLSRFASEELDVSPAQRDQLALAQAGIGGYPHQLGVLRVLVRAGGQLVIPDTLCSRIAMGVRAYPVVEDGVDELPRLIDRAR